ncbi:hypothetical protein, partial [Arachnia propionica]|uniref:hypothetical protein n=1 Tax=Arachnia propionica TaxID=1750 RepID=UPI001C8A7A18
IALVVAIVVAVVGFGGWWFLGNQDSQQAQPQPTAVVPTQPRDQSPAPTQTQAQPQGQQPESQPQPSSQGQSQPPTQEQPEVEPEEPKVSRKPSGQDTGKSRQDSTPAPPLPKRFAQFTFEEEKQSKGESARYRAEDGTSVTVTYADYVTFDELELDGARPIGDWSCFTQKKEGQTDTVACGGPAYEGVVFLGAVADNYSPQDIAGIGDSLMAVWK